MQNVQRPVSGATKKFEIKRAQIKEMPKVCDIITSSADWYRKFVDEKDMAEHEVGAEWISNNYFRRKFYLGYLDNKAVGTISMQKLGDYDYLGYIYLDTDYVGQGIGKRLITHAEKISRKENRKGMVLIAHPEAKWAVKAYEKYGFKKVEEDREKILSWQNHALVPYYEEGFHLYMYQF